MGHRAPGKTGEMKRMKESYGEGVANHTGPESCVANRKVGIEALTGEIAGQGIEPRNILDSGTPTPWCQAEGNIRRIVNARCNGVPRGRRPWARKDTSRTGTGRSRVRPRSSGLGTYREV